MSRPFLKFLIEAFARQGDRVPSWLTVAFAVGVELFFAWPSDPGWTGTAIAAVIAILLAVVARRRGNSILPTVLALAIVAEFAAGQMRTAIVAAPALDRETRPVELAGNVAEVQRQPNFVRIILRDVRLSGAGDVVAPGSVRLTTLLRHGVPRVGDRIEIRAALRPLDLPPVPGGFQFQRFLFFDGIGATAFTLAPWRVVDAGETSTVRASLEGLRRQISDRILEVIPGDAGAVAVALITGEQSLIREQVQDDYRASGLVHLLSISGVHMTLLAAIMFFFVRRGLALWPYVALRWDIKKVAAWAALAATLFYLSISGLSVPAVRAFLMVAVVLTAVLLDRRAMSIRSVGWAALAVLILFPEALIGPSFQLSFLAVVALIALYEHYALKPTWRDHDGRWQVWSALKLYVGGLVVTDIVAGSVTSVVAAYHFSNVPIYSSLGNLLAAPVTGLWIMPLGLLALAAMPFGLDQPLLQVMGIGVGAINEIAATVADWPSAQVHVPPMSNAALIAAGAGVLFVSLWRGRERWLGLVPILFAVVQPWIVTPPDLLVAAEGDVVAITDARGRLVMSPGRAERFVRSVWVERYGRSTVRWPGRDGMACDAVGCVLTRAGARIAVALSRDALGDDCDRVDAVVAPDLTIGSCGASRVFDREDFARDGTHAFWMTDGGVRVVTVRNRIGERLWNRSPAMRRVVNNDGTDPPDDPGP